MGKKTEKLKLGEVSKYLSRNQAIRKLQVTLKQFRRLCILKGIYPVEPSNKKIQKKSTKLQTFYYKKDIKFLMHEPILHTMREEDVFKRKLGKLLYKKENATINVLKAQQPHFKLDHLVKERYPTFEDALKDLDDCMSLIALFSTLNGDAMDNQKSVFECQRLLNEFMSYVVKVNALRKTFLSIKGIYYQVEIKGVTVTWICPYQFSMDMPHDVDFRVMNTFLEFNQTLLGFVNFKLYNDLGLPYPPKEEAQEIPVPLESKYSKELQKKIDGSLPAIANDDEAEVEAIEEENEEAANNDFEQEASYNGQLFKGLVFFISREVPLYLAKFIIQACGGTCGWNEVAGHGSPFQEADSRITIQITDRPSIVNEIQGREYIQPQWLYDCVNANKLLKTNGYHVGESLPPHLSPFVVAGEDDYSPTEIVKVYVFNKTVEPTAPIEEEVVEKEESKDEEKELAKIMMSKRDRKLYDKMQFGKKRKQEAAEKLRQKKASINK